MKGYPYIRIALNFQDGKSCMRNPKVEDRNFALLRIRVSRLLTTVLSMSMRLKSVKLGVAQKLRFQIWIEL